MSRPLDRLYELLPVVHRARDAEQGYPLQALLRVINEQANVVEDDIAQLYENWFIETCDDWVVPYIGDLMGYRAVHQAGDEAAASPAAVARSRLLIPRRDVAGTLGFRRRKGTLALLEELAASVARWPARAVEGYALLAWTQHLNHRRLERARGVDLRSGKRLELLNSPFDPSARTVDLRRPVSIHLPGRYNLGAVALFVWRLRVYSITHAPACCIEGAGPESYSFNVLGHDTQLYTLPRPEASPTDIAGELNLPIPIRRRALEHRTSVHPLHAHASEQLYGPGKSMVIHAPGWPSKQSPQPVPASYVKVADLSDWTYRAPRGHVALDPVLGRMVFPVGQFPKLGVWVSYHMAFSADIGGGEYERPLAQPLLFTLYGVDKQGKSGFQTINGALARWRADQQALGAAPADPGELALWEAEHDRLRAAIIEIGDSGAYSEPLSIELEAGEYLQLRAGNGWRPVLRQLDYTAERPDAFTVSGKRASRFTLDGVLVTGRGMQIIGPDRCEPERMAQGDLCDVTLRHVTLVPGWSLACDCGPRRPSEASLELLYTGARVRIEHSIVGAIEVAADEVRTDPVDLTICDSIVDATDACRPAVGGGNLGLAFVRLCIARSTVLGTLSCHAIGAAENSLFAGAVMAGRRQLGCMRYCYVPPGSRTPRRYRCQPETAVMAAVDALRAAARDAGQAPPTNAEMDEARAQTIERVLPRHTSERYGNPGYCQLACDCAPEIAAGADDESEMGVFHDLYQPQRAANLRARLEEYTPAGMDAGIWWVN